MQQKLTEKDIMTCMYEARLQAEDLLFSQVPVWQEAFQKGYLTPLMYLVEDSSVDADAVSLETDLLVDHGRQLIAVNLEKFTCSALRGSLAAQRFYVQHLVAREMRHVYQRLVCKLSDEDVLKVPSTLPPQAFLSRVQRWRTMLPTAGNAFLNDNELETDAEAFGYYLAMEACGHPIDVSEPEFAPYHSQILELRTLYGPIVSAPSYPDRRAAFQAEAASKDYTGMRMHTMEDVENDLSARTGNYLSGRPNPHGINSEIPVNPVYSQRYLDAIDQLITHAKSDTPPFSS